MEFNRKRQKTEKHQPQLAYRHIYPSIGVNIIMWIFEIVALH